MTVVGIALESLAALPAAAQNAKTAPKAATSSKCKPSMVYIPDGTFTMGNPSVGDKDVADIVGDEHRLYVAKLAMSFPRQVTVEAFCIDRNEVTVAAYAACVRAKKCEADGWLSVARAGRGPRCNKGVAGRSNHPMNCVNWYHAEAYCVAQGQRLPTEEEWEFAARGTDGRVYPWGNDAPKDQLCWSEYNIAPWLRTSTCAVGSYPKGRSPFGLNDMAGNVWEWTSTEGNTPFGSSPHRIARGGAWTWEEKDVRSFRRDWWEPTREYDYFGFRCAGEPLP